jgi:signal transduction histidine kinase
MGSRVWYVCFAIGLALGIVCLMLTLVIGARYLRLSSAEGVKLFVLWGPLAVLMLVPGLVPSRRKIRLILSWSAANDKSERAVATWYQVVRNRQIVVTAGLFVAAIIPPAAIDIAIRYHKPWWSVFPFSTAFAIALASVATLVIAIADLMMRPMLEEIAGYLPENFEPNPVGRRLQIKALVPLPLVTGFATVLVGAFADASTNSVIRLSIALGCTIAIAALATIVYSILNRSVLSPIDDLTAATARVRAGDISVAVPVVTDDELAALAVGFNRMLVDLRSHAEELRASRERIVTAGNAERRRVERDLHDGAQQLLVLAQLKLGLAEKAIDTDPAAAKQTVAELRADMSKALSELRDLARGIYPARLESDGLPGALQEAVARAAIPAHFDGDGAGRYSRELEAAVYFCCLEALQNAAKHAGSEAQVEVMLGSSDGSLRFEISDDGCGFDLAAAGARGGLQNMGDRIGALGGELRVESRPGAGTRVRGAVPVH